MQFSFLSRLLYRDICISICTHLHITRGLIVSSRSQLSVTFSSLFFSAVVSPRFRRSDTVSNNLIINGKRTATVSNNFYVNSRVKSLLSLSVEHYRTIKLVAVCISGLCFNLVPSIWINTGMWGSCAAALICIGNKSISIIKICAWHKAPGRDGVYIKVQFVICNCARWL